MLYFCFMLWYLDYILLTQCYTFSFDITHVDLRCYQAVNMYLIRPIL